ncbi:L-aspartate oxidase [Microbacterium halophytorum]|uniref:L-aspartate oxidase n=1 Tax=Microbacterium halophytorum TaxID=2067568 RepID=UPI001E301C68|nr:FAD-binding protein [Microbacterium halophytorum]
MSGAGGACRVVVVGSGIAGLTAALEAHAAGACVTVLTKAAADASSTRFAQGGIAAVTTPDDSVASHIEDTLIAGGGHADPDAVRALVTEGIAAIVALEARGVAFDRDADGEPLLGREGAHSLARILHAGGDATGAEIQRALLAECAARGIAVREGAFVTDIVVEAGQVAGVRVLGGRDAPYADHQNASSRWRCEAAAQLSIRRESSRRRTPAAHSDGMGSARIDRSGGAERAGGHRRAPEPDTACADELVRADAVILATGGLGQVYGTTTNPDVATGDGVALALRAGAEVRDMEFVQFHPTVLAAGEPFLISEAVRGEGAVLRDEHGRRFALDAHPDGELAPRDVVARAISRAMAEQGGRPVQLDATALGADFLARRFPTIDRAVRERGLDWSREPIPVAPAAHYAMGGVATELDGRTSVPGLFAAGETARTGVHGANRLASNSLLEGAVFGARAGRAARIPDGAYVSAREEAPAGGAAFPTGHPPQSTSTHVRAASPFDARFAGDPVSGAVEPNAASEPVQRPDTTAQLGITSTSTTPLTGAAPAASPHQAPTPPAAAFSRAALQRLMRRRAGLERDGDGLTAAAETIAAWRAHLPAPHTPYEHEDRNLLDVAAEIIAAAAARVSSLGAHWRSDAPTDRGPEHSRPAQPAPRARAPRRSERPDAARVPELASTRAHHIPQPAYDASADPALEAAC